MADGYEQVTPVVINTAPSGQISVLLIRHTAAEILRARHLDASIEIIYGVKYRIAVWDIHDGAIGEDVFHALDKDFPFVSPVKIVAHKEAAAIEKLAHPLCLTVRQ